MARPSISSRRSVPALKETARSLFGGITLEENASGFIWEGTIAAGAEALIRNKLRDGLIPNRYIVLNQTPVSTLCMGTTVWDRDYVYIFNSALGSTVTGIIYFYKQRGVLQ